MSKTKGDAEQARREKERLLLSLARPEKAIQMLAELGLFKEAVWKFACPSRQQYYSPGCLARAKLQNSNCHWRVDRMGANPDCPYDAELKAAWAATNWDAVKRTLSSIATVGLQEIRGGHAVDMIVTLPTQVIAANGFIELMLPERTPREFYIVVDLYVADILKAIRYFHLLLAGYPSRHMIPPPPQPILITFNDTDAVKATLEGQGIRVYVTEKAEIEDA